LRWSPRRIDSKSKGTGLHNTLWLDSANFTPKARESSHISTPKEAAKVSDKTLPPAPVIIPIPDHQPIPKSPENSAQPTADIGGQPVRANDKPPGTLYVSVRFSEVTRYRGTLDENTTRDAVKVALEKTGKIKVFLGNNAIGRPGQRRYGVGNLAPDKRQTVYYFSKTLEDACTAIKGIISGVIGAAMECTLIAPPLHVIEIQTV
jgi:hypothetical protein